VEGDGQGDLAGHGGENRAVMVYQMDAYHYWEAQLGRNDFSFGQFGENFTVDGLSDDEVCIGDRYRIGSALFEVTQPRVTCYRVGIRMAEPAMPALLVSHHRPGFYFRVLEEGEVGAGDEIKKVADGPNASQWPTWMPCSICQTPRANNSKARCACRHSAQGGKRL
jgi:MOSC domain-containing protein YiiM